MQQKQSLTEMQVRIILCLIALTGLAGCANTQGVTLHPIQGSDIVLLSKDQDFKAPKQGAFLSDQYLQEVAKVRVLQ